MLRHFKRKWRPIPLVALVVVIWVLLAGTVAAIQSRSDPPLISFELEESTEPSTVQSVDLPPVVLQLTTEEAAQARDITQTTTGIQDRISGSRYRIVGVYAEGLGVLAPEVRPPKRVDVVNGEETCYEVHCAKVLIYDYDQDVVIAAVVDLSVGRLLRVHEKEVQPGGHGQPPLSNEEGQHALGLAQADPKVQAVMASQKEHLYMGAMGGGTKTGSCLVHRCAFLGFELEDGRTFLILVDLSLDRVVDQFFPGDGS